jgi:hypothetical protein
VYNGRVVVSALPGMVVVAPGIVVLGSVGIVVVDSVGTVVVGESAAVVDVDSSGLDADAGRADVAAMVKALSSATPLRTR